MIAPARRAARSSLLLATALSVAACEDNGVEARVFSDLDACLAEAADSQDLQAADECRAAFETAQAEHERTAPRYAEQALCEEQHGGECTVQQASGGGSFFMPLMMGYMMGNMMSGGAGALRSQPLYRTAEGRFATATGATRVASLSGTQRLRPSAFAPAPSTAQAAPMTRATVRATGGFGQARATGAPSTRPTGTSGRSAGGFRSGGFSS